MKKQKLSLEELKLQSFVTEIDGNADALGGSTPLASIIVVSIFLTFPEEVNRSADTCGITPKPPVDAQPTNPNPAEEQPPTDEKPGGGR